MRLHPFVGIGLVALAALPIAVLTLMPQPVPAFVPWGHGCLVCGADGMADMLANVALFVPLGIALALAGLPWWAAVLAGGTLSTGVELAQLLVIPGRFATLSDVVTNTTGTALGAALVVHRARWLRPAGERAWRLVAVAATFFVGTLAGSGWALGGMEDASSDAPRIDPVPVPTMAGWFAGHVLSARLGDYTTSHRGTGPVTMTSPARRNVRAEVVVSGFDPRPNELRLLFVHRAGAPDPWLELIAEGRLLVLEPGLRGRRLRLRQPAVVLPRRLPGEAESPIPYRFAAAVTDDRLTIAFEQGTTRRFETMRLSPTLGWTLVSPFPRANAPLAGYATALWLVALAGPLGYWARWVAMGRRGPVPALAAVAATLGVGLALVPTAGGFAVARWWEWITAAGGAVAGAALAEAGRRRARYAGATIRTRPSASS